jgi:hypothetical protein
MYVSHNYTYASICTMVPSTQGGTGEVPVLLVHDWQKWKSCDADCDVHDGHGLDDSDVHDANDGIDKTVVLVPM